MLYNKYVNHYEWVFNDISRLYRINLDGIFRTRCLTILNYYYKRYLCPFHKNVFLTDYEKKCIDIAESYEAIYDYMQLIYFGISFVALSYDDYPNDYSFNYGDLLHIAMYCFSRIVLTESVAFRKCARLIEYTEAKDYYAPNDKHDYEIINKLYSFAKQLFFQYDQKSHLNLEYYIKKLGFPNTDESAEMTIQQ